MIALLFVACRAPASEPDPARIPGVTTWTLGDLRVHALRTGWVRVKAPHREHRTLDAFAVAAVIVSGTWAEWMPVFTYVVEHPERTVAVDTGVGPGIDADLACADEGTRWFYSRNLRFRSLPGDTLAERLVEAGIDGGTVDDVLVTHFHADHLGGFAAIPRATVWTGPGNWPTHVGATPCLVPADRPPRALSYDAQGVGPFSASQPLVADGRVRAVPLPGHTPGHAGLWIEGPERALLIVGDATFDLDQTARGAVSAVSEGLDDARATQALLARAVADGVVLLPAHDPTVPFR